MFVHIIYIRTNECKLISATVQCVRDWGLEKVCLDAKFHRLNCWFATVCVELRFFRICQRDVDDYVIAYQRPACLLLYTMSSTTNSPMDGWSCPEPRIVICDILRLFSCSSTNSSGCCNDDDHHQIRRPRYGVFVALDFFLLYLSDQEKEEEAIE